MFFFIIKKMADEYFIRRNIRDQLRAEANNQFQAQQLSLHQIEVLSFDIPTYVNIIMNQQDLDPAEFTRKARRLNQTPVNRRFNLWHATMGMYVKARQIARSLF